MTPARCTPAERKVFNSRRCSDGHGGYVRETEPALGTLDERLGIIVRRLGGTTKLSRIHTPKQLEAYAS
jgi:hypothetical protein